MLTLDKLAIEQGDFRLSADLEIETGASVAVIGPSGAGKSTLLSVIAGFLAPSAGRVLWDSAEITGTAPGERPLSILFQDQNLFPHLTLETNLALGLNPKGKIDRAARAQIEGALARVGLEGLGKRKPGQISGGQQSRAGLARALLRARPMLLLDEPFAALGPALKTEMLALVAEIAREQGTTVLMVSHDPEDARVLCPQTVLVAEGKAHPPQDTTALLADPPPVLREYLGEGARPRD
ncbi:MAG: ATP-binding cassette domain-containing protein [Thioclava marina]|jgi:ABC-type thiamine transport system, ATPase component|uniref:Thiamine ABC transporter ATP-binding protein n=1 Tax=Thioclava marina TaxID=1915077 RepID=A0ABX3MNU7_9RHOB|nr:ATP-binding cassette domain-containing protein [Thioclava marina]MBC7144293.1 ATP-binding cassette domain-containing protein [Thioclava marina]OOY13102.1 thiamine ABC transporter ATP-binding protein [Thioclava marina]